MVSTLQIPNFVSDTASSNSLSSYALITVAYPKVASLGAFIPSLFVRKLAPGDLSFSASMAYDLRNACPSKVERLQREPKSVIHEDIKVVYDSYGSGLAAVVYIHGRTCSRALWIHQNPLYTRYRSILVDLPGHGESDKPEIDYDHELFSRSVKAVLDAEGVSRAVFVAHSMGGPVATMFLWLFPDTVAGIVYLDSFWRVPESYLTDEERTRLLQWRSDDINFRTKIEGLLTTATSAATRGAVISAMLATPTHVRSSAVSAGPHSYALPWEKMSQTPALHLAVQGAWYDGCWKHHLPNLEVREFLGLSHFLHMDDPDTINAAIEVFVVENKLLF
jgi:pimeloyl-ACP methyl ester carboxylesterase